MADIVVRAATIADASGVGDLWLRLVEYHRQLDDAMPVPTPRGTQLYARRIANQIEDPDARVLVAEHRGNLVGYVVGMVMDIMPDTFEQERTGFLADIYVDAAFRGQGTGRALVDALAGWFRDKGLRHYEWYVAAQNFAGRSFWRAVGGREVMIRMQAPVESAYRSNINSEE